LEVFWSKITEIPSNPEAIEYREEIAEESSLELKSADSICEPGSMWLKVERVAGHDSCMEGMYGGATLSQKVGNHSSLWEEFVRLIHFLNFFAVVHKCWIGVEWLRVEQKLCQEVFFASLRERLVIALTFW
jgi:hypothetical protein